MPKELQPKKENLASGELGFSVLVLSLSRTLSPLSLDLSAF